MLQKFLVSVAVFSMVAVLGSNDACARVNGRCTKCERVRVHRVHFSKQKHLTCAVPASCSTCSEGNSQVSDMQVLTPVADPGPMPAAETPASTPAVETAPSEPSPSAADGGK
jgi:hypothetical protein